MGVVGNLSTKMLSLSLKSQVLCLVGNDYSPGGNFFGFELSSQKRSSRAPTRRASSTYVIISEWTFSGIFFRLLETVRERCKILLCLWKTWNVYYQMVRRPLKKSNWRLWWRIVPWGALFNHNFCDSRSDTFLLSSPLFGKHVYYHCYGLK